MSGLPAKIARFLFLMLLDPDLAGMIDIIFNVFFWT